MTSTRPTRMTRTAAVVATGLVACAPLLATAPAHAKDGRVTASGSFSVEVRTANRSGNDVITAVATRGAKTCSGTVTLPA